MSFMSKAPGTDGIAWKKHALKPAKSFSLLTRLSCIRVHSTGPPSDPRREEMSGLQIVKHYYRKLTWRTDTRHDNTWQKHHKFPHGAAVLLPLPHAVVKPIDRPDRRRWEHLGAQKIQRRNGKRGNKKARTPPQFRQWFSKKDLICLTVSVFS